MNCIEGDWLIGVGCFVMGAAFILLIGLPYWKSNR